MVESCSTCRFWEATDWETLDPEKPDLKTPSTYGECRRFPPSVVQVGSGDRASGFPIIAPDCGCGEHKHTATPAEKP